MNLYELPQINLFKNKTRTVQLVVLVIVISVIFGFISGIVSVGFFYSEIQNYLEKLNINLPSVIEKVEKEEEKIIKVEKEEEKIIKVVEETSPAVVSIVISKDVPILEKYYEVDPFFGFPTPQYRQKGTEKQEIGGGTGFIISQDGLILTNKHVILEEGAGYTVFTNDGRKFSAKVLARDPFQDLAIIKIEQNKMEPFPIVKLGDSDNLKSGQTVIAIGNALGEFRNTVSTGVVSGLGRKITASGGDFVETLEDVIQTDAAINKGNSGGPLLNLKGEVIGINTAMVIGAQSIGFAVPINKAKKAIEQVREIGKIVYPFLGVRYILVNEKVQAEYNLAIDHGAFIIRGESGESAIWPGSAAEKAGLKEKDIVLEFNGGKITIDNSLAKLITKYNPGDKVKLKILRGEKEFEVEVVLDEKSE